MTGIELQNYPTFHEAARRLRGDGVIVVNPAEAFDGDSSRRFKEYLRRDIELVLTCDAIIFLAGWRESRGAKAEAHVAHALGLDAYEYTEDGDGYTLAPIRIPSFVLGDEDMFPEAAPLDGPDDASTAIEDRLSTLPPIGLVGVHGAGKDTVGATLVSEFGYRRVALAEELKWEVYRAIGPERAQFSGFQAFYAYMEAHKHVDLHQRHGWVRQLLQAWGQMRRDLDGDCYWLDKVRIAPGVVVTDVRHPNEADLILDAGGLIVRIDRAGYVAGAHPTERPDLLPASYAIVNDGTVADLHAAVHRLMTDISARPGMPKRGTRLTRKGSGPIVL